MVKKSPKTTKQKAKPKSKPKAKPQPRKRNQRPIWEEIHDTGPIPCFSPEDLISTAQTNNLMLGPQPPVFNPRQSNRLAIVGWASSTRDLAPFDDPSFDIWGCNEIAQFVGQRATLNFQLHNAAEIKRKASVGYDKRMEMVVNAPYPTMVQPSMAHMPNTVEFPFDDIRAKYGDFFTSSIAWMLVYALDLGYDEIHIYGVDMAAEDEYSHQRPCLAYWIGVGRGMGVDIILPEHNSLLVAPYLYAVEEPQDFHGGPVGIDFLNQMLRDSRTKANELRCGAWKLEGASDTLEFLIKRQIDHKRQQGQTNAPETKDSPRSGTIDSHGSEGPLPG